MQNFPLFTAMATIILHDVYRNSTATPEYIYNKIIKIYIVYLLT